MRKPKRNHDARAHEALRAPRWYERALGCALVWATGCGGLSERTVDAAAGPGDRGGTSASGGANGNGGRGASSPGGTSNGSGTDPGASLGGSSNAPGAPSDTQGASGAGAESPGAWLACTDASLAQTERCMPRFKALPIICSEQPTSWSGLSPDGGFVVGTACEPTRGLLRAMTWSPAGLSGLPGTDFGLIHVTASSFGANVIVGDGGPDAAPFRWETGGVRFLLEGQQGLATAVTPEGSVVVGTLLAQNGHFHAFRWSEATGTVDLGALAEPGADDYGVSVSADGSIVLGQTEASGAFVWTARDGFEAIGGSAGKALDISADGTTVVGAFAGETPLAGGFVWNHDEIELFADVPSAVNGDGSLIVGGSTAAVGWSAGGAPFAFADVLAAAGVDLTGWELTRASDVSSDGRVVMGDGLLKGQARQWIAWLP